MAVVWSARDNVLGRMVAVKVMRADPEHEALFRLRFRDEAMHSAMLLHPNIVTVFDYGEHDELAFLVMELVSGDPLNLLLRSRGPMEPELVSSIIGQAAIALGVAHEARVVHRDVKPGNIILRGDGVVKLTDFGIARALDSIGHTYAGEMIGTPHYMSPEQAMGDGATGASDLYSLGVVAHELLTGSRPFDGGTPVATAMKHIQHQPPPLPDSTPEPLAMVVEDLLEKDPANRPPNAKAVAIRLGLADDLLRAMSIGLAHDLSGDSPFQHGDTSDPHTPAPEIPTAAASDFASDD